MPKKSGFRWQPNDLVNGLTAFDGRLHHAVRQVVEYHAVRAETAMRTTAPWRDRTGNARSGLHANAEHFVKSHRITLSHAVPYGIWLEVRHAGRYAVIMPTVRSEGRQLMRSMRLVIREMKR